MSQARFQKRMREKARQDKARAKRARKQNRAEEAEEAEVASQGDEPPAAPEPVVLDQLAALHERFEADEIDFEEFEQRKHELFAQLDV
jgi:hypothetical protein